MRPESGAGILLSAEERREVLGRIRGDGGVLAEENQRGRQTNIDREEGTPQQLGSQFQEPQGGDKGSGQQRRQW